MSLAAPSVDDLFGGLPANERLDRFEMFKSAMSTAQARSYNAASRGEIAFVKGEGIVKGAASVSPASSLEAMRSEMITKGMSADVVAEAQSAIDRLVDIQKDWTNSTPLTGAIPGNYGLVPYDLDPALALLVPRSFILRNSVSRIGGVGQAKEFRRITGVSNSGTGGVSNLSTFFSSAGASQPFGGGAVNLQRPPKISYAADRKVVSYVESGVSDEVFMQAQFSAQGYTDLRQLSHTSLLWATMLGEERNMLNGRGNNVAGNVGFVGGLTRPVVTDYVSAAATTSGGTLVGGTDTLYFKITLSSSAGETLATSAEGSRAVSGSNNSVTITAPTALPAAALAWNVYSGTVSGTYTSKTVVIGSSVTILTAGSGSFTVPSAASDSNQYGYDGLVSVYTDPTQAGYVKRLNGAFSTSEPGAEFQDAFQSLFSSVIADPDTILTGGSTRRALAKAIQASGGSSTGYRINYEGGDGVNIGSVVTGLVNEVTGKLVDVVAHPYMPAGVALIWQKNLPFPDSGVAETTQIASVQDMMVLEWPVVQMSYDASSYMINTMLHRAPAWSGAITGITG
jgi:hypothetical protein